MKRNRFLIGSIVLLLLVLIGGIYKHTALREQRVVLSYPYQMEYTIEIPDVDAEIAKMYFKGMGLYLDERTSAGTVSKVKTAAAASGAAERVDVTLTVSASGLRLSSQSRGKYTLSQANSCHFLSNFMEFDGYITQVEEE